MSTTVSNIVAAVGGVGVIAFLIWMAVRGRGEREAEEAARVFFDERGHWPDELPPGAGEPER
jgi:hypothetical protein